MLGRKRGRLLGCTPALVPYPSSSNGAECSPALRSTFEPFRYYVETRLPNAFIREDSVEPPSGDRSDDKVKGQVGDEVG